jgi:hypothetical protein
MKGHWLFISGAVCGVAAVAVLPKAGMELNAAAAQTMSGVHAPAGAAPVHTEEKFAFTARASMKEVAPLFGANKERVWSPQWDPRFIHPLPAADVPGMVFTVKHGQRESIWVNTDFDVENGRMRYVYIIPNALVTVITVRLTPEGNHTTVEVQYDRTALNAEADARVRQMAQQDRKAGPDWEAQVNGYLEKLKRSAP